MKISYSKTCASALNPERVWSGFCLLLRKNLDAFAMLGDGLLGNHIKKQNPEVCYC